MRTLIAGIAGAALLAGGAALTFSSLAGAQPAPTAGPPTQVIQAPAAPSPGPLGGRPEDRAWSPARGPADGGHWAGPWTERHALHAIFAWRNTWGLFHRPTDLGLSPSDVQTIAEAILLRNGQHDWKVGEVTPNADHTVSFAFVTAHGDVIARFTMDTSNGRITRTD
jgi:hypothetical protein